MDSLTQIVLGASMGEMVAGRKIGNKAMIWGAIAGTIPDLDVFGGIFGMSVEDALAFHRAISHSLFFAVIAPLLLALYTWWYYGNNHHQKKPMKIITATAAILFMCFCGTIVNFIPFVATQKISWITVGIVVLLVGFLSYRLITNYVNKQKDSVTMSYSRWYLLFFLAVVTHPILDCCTGYGTQLFQPFSDMRLAWNNISVADPLYTLPFLILLILAATRHKTNRWRSILNYMAFGWSMLYMMWTVRNKYIVDQVFEHSLQQEQVNYSRCMTTPSILNNVLWHCIAEGDSVYYDGYYSLLDKEKVVKLNVIEKNHELITNYDDKRIKILTWFSNGYYNVMEIGNDTLQVNDLRYGAQIGGDLNTPESYIFPFKIYPNGSAYILKSQEGPPPGSMDEFWKLLWTRVAGI